MTLIMTPVSVRVNSTLEQNLDWMRSQGINPDHTYKVEIDSEAMVATIFQYKCNAEGKHYCNDNFTDVMTEEPWSKYVTSLPPGGFTIKSYSPTFPQ